MIHKYSIYTLIHTITWNMMYDSLEFITTNSCVTFHFWIQYHVITENWILFIESSIFSEENSIFSNEFTSWIHVNEIRSMNSDLILWIQNSYVNSDTHATELVLDRPGFSETFDLLDSSKWSRRWVKCFKHFKIEFESNTQNYLNGGQWSWFCLGICYSCTTSS